MNPSQLNSKSWLGALAGAIKAFCMLFVRGVNVADDALAMADSAVHASRERQAIDLSIEMSNYAQRARDQAVLVQVKSEESMIDFCHDNADRKERVERCRVHLDKLIQGELSSLRAKDVE
jgi:hypothetical protein